MKAPISKGRIWENFEKIFYWKVSGNETDNGKLDVVSYFSGYNLVLLKYQIAF